MSGKGKKKKRGKMLEVISTLNELECNVVFLLFFFFYYTWECFFIFWIDFLNVAFLFVIYLLIFWFINTCFFFFVVVKVLRKVY